MRRSNWKASIGILVLAGLAFLFPSGQARAATISPTVTDGIVNSVSGDPADRSATHSIVTNWVDPNFNLRNGYDTAGFGYRIIGQASADSTFLTGADSASVAGTAYFGFTLPTDPTGAALWNITVSVVYDGVAASDGGDATGTAGLLGLTSTGAAAGISDTLYGAGSATYTAYYFLDTYNQQNNPVLTNVLPGSGSINLNLNLSANSSGSEAIAAIGQTSTMSSFSLNSVVQGSDAASINVMFTPHLNFTGQTLTTGLALASGENLNGYGTVSGNISGVAGSSITSSGSGLVLGNSGSAAGFDFSGTLNVGTSTVTLRDSNDAVLRGTTNLGDGTINAANGLSNVGTINILGGSSTIGGNVTNQAGGEMRIDSGRAATFTGNLINAAGGSVNLGGGTINAANGLSNFGMINFYNGSSTISGNVTSQAGGWMVIPAGSSATFTENLINMDGSSVQASGNVTVGGVLTNDGIYFSGGTTTARDLVVGGNGYLSAAWTGSAWILSNDFLNQSTMGIRWDTSAANLSFVTGTDSIHSLALAGADIGQDPAGYANNFAWRRLDFTGQSLVLSDGNTGNAGSALYVGEILGVVRLQNPDGSWSASNITGNGLNIYYDPVLTGNSYLGGLRYAMTSGGSLSPVPIPSTVLLFGSGLLGLLGLGRRRMRAASIG